MSAVLRRLKWIIAGFNNHKAINFKPRPSPPLSPLPSNASLPSTIPTPSPEHKQQSPIRINNSVHKHRSAKQHHPPPAPPLPPPPELPMLEAVHEIGIYIHRFHNLDLFQQGWYQIKITMRWEDTDSGAVPAPSRVVQYEAPDLGCDDVCGVWRIDDTDHSFSTQPFRIRYARQDILLSVMISFNLSLGKQEVGLSASAVIIKFELLYAPVLEKRSNLQASLDACPAAVHEFRIPAKALLGLHSYCPVHFDALHAVLVDVSVHISFLKGGVYTSSKKVVSDSSANEGVAGEQYISNQILLVKSLLLARDFLLEELQKLSQAINEKIDLHEFTSKLDERKLFDFSTAAVETGVAELSDLSIKPHVAVEESNGGVDFQNKKFPNSMSKDELFQSFNSLGNQLLYLWNVFLSFHRSNRTKILEYLRDSWANDRKAEWSIWIVHSKVDMPHQYISSAIDGSSIHSSVRNKMPVSKKLIGDPAQASIMRADLHRRSIAQMRINNRSIQDMHIFGDPSRIPVVIVESVVNAPRRSTSGNSYFSDLGYKDSHNQLFKTDTKAVDKLSGTSTWQHGRNLKVVVFVHGFQGHHLDLRLVRNQWLLLDPKVEILMSEANEDKTSGDFREMGERLAEEVISFVKKKMDKISRSGPLKSIKLSFVGHSIGNIIIRTALTEGIMEPYLGFLYTYISLSGPHLGYLYSSNSLFNSGLWLLKKLKGTQCIHQLTFTDSPDIKSTFLYQLCKQKTLENFKNIILLSSPQDGYVPYHSARIEMCPASAGDYSKRGHAFLEMLNDCLDQIRAQSLEQRVFMRCDVNFDISVQGKNLNTIIGRAAHIEFLETDIFARFIMWSFPHLFR